MTTEAVRNQKSLLQIFLLVLGCVAGMALGGVLVAVTLLASPLVTVLILLFLVGYGIVAAVTSGRSGKIVEKKN